MGLGHGLRHTNSLHEGGAEGLAFVPMVPEGRSVVGIVPTDRLITEEHPKTLVGGMPGFH